MTSRPRTPIGVVIPVHGDHERMLETALDAVVSQSVEPVSVVVVVDGPNAGIEDLLRDHPAGFDSVVLSNNTGGPSTPRNVGAAHLLSRHDLDAIWFLDSDDIPHPRFLETVCRALTDDQEADLVSTRFRHWRGIGEPPVLEEPKAGDLDRHPIDLDWYMRKTGAVLPSFTVVRTRALPSLRDSGLPFDSDYRYNQDYDLFVRLLYRRKGIRVDWCGGVYRLHEAGVSAQGSKAWLCRNSVDRDLKAYFQTQGDERNVRRMRIAEGSSLRRAARHLWRRGERSTAIRLLADDVRENRAMGSLMLLLTLPVGLDPRSRLIPRQGDTRLSASRKQES